MKSRRILCMTALMLAMLLAMGGCKQAEAKEASTQPVEQVEETEETTEEPTIGESTEEELKAEAAAKAEAEKKAAEEAAAKAEAEKKAAEESAAKAEAEKKAAEEAAAKAENETVTAQAETTTSGDGAVEAATPSADTANSDDYALNEYGNPSRDIVGKGLVDYINPSDPAITRMIGVGGYHGSTPIPNPCAKIDPVSPFIGMKNPPADWPKPDASKEGGGAGEYKWDPETGCWRYYNSLGEATGYYKSLYGQKTMRCSEKKTMLGSEVYETGIASSRGVY